MKALRQLVKLNFLTPRGLLRLISSFHSEGTTLMAILRFCDGFYADACAVVDGHQRLTYHQLYLKARQMAVILNDRFRPQPRAQAAILCRNSLASTLALTALHRLGFHIRLLNTDIPAAQMQQLLQHRPCDLLVYDEDIREHCLPAELPCKAVSTATLSRWLNEEADNGEHPLPHCRMGGNISVLTGGSSGRYKEASRKSHVGQYLPPLLALVNDIHIQDYRSVLISLPFYHGFGLATLIVSLAIGKKVVLLRQFHAEEVMAAIRQEQVEVLPVVPAMLNRLWQHADAAASLRSVKCVISGGDRLEQHTVEATHAHLGECLFNLYGTSEAGFFLLTPPDRLLRYGQIPIGRPIDGVKCEIRDADENGVGILWVKSGWAMTSHKNLWQSTGDRASCNADGYFFYQGRSDNMVVCGGENVFPEHVEHVICRHPDVSNAAVFPVPDARFGMVLHASVELVAGSALTEESLLDWLRPQLSRAELPHRILFSEIQMRSTGKRSMC